MPITINNNTAVAGAAFTIKYDPDFFAFQGLMQATQVIADGNGTNPDFASAMFYQVNDKIGTIGTAKIGQLLVVAASAQGFSSTTLFNAKFKILGGSGSYPVELLLSQIQNPQAGYPTPTTLPVLVGLPAKTANAAGFYPTPIYTTDLVNGAITVNAPGYRISGGITYPGAIAANGSTVTLKKKQTSTGQYLFDASATVSNGSYSFSNKTAGEYLLTVRSYDPAYFVAPANLTITNMAVTQNFILDNSATVTIIDPLLVTNGPAGNALTSATTNDYNFSGGTGAVFWTTTAGIIDSSGLFVAPAVTTGSEVITITATDSQVPGVKATIQVTIYADVIINNKPTETPLVASGTTSSSFNVAGGDASAYVWTISGPVAVTGGTGASYSFRAPSTGNFAGEYTIAVSDGNAGDTFSDSFTVMVPAKVTPGAQTFIETTSLPLALTGSSGTGFIWEILASTTATTEVETPAGFGTFDAQTAAPTFTPAAVEAITTFYLRVTVTGDADLTSTNGLDTLIAGPYTIVPLEPYTVVLSDSNGLIDGTSLMVGDITVSVTSMGATTTQNLTAANGEVVFILPATGGRVAFTVNDTRATPLYFNTVTSSSLATIPVTLTMIGTDTIIGSVQDKSTSADLTGATISAFQPSELTKLNPQIFTGTVIGKTYTIALPIGAAQNGWRVIASSSGYVSQQLYNQAVGTVDFTGADALQEESVLTVTATPGVGSVQIDVAANPAFANAAQAAFILLDGTGSLSGAPSLANATISETYNALSDFTVRIKADTSEDNDPTIGYKATRIFNYFHGGDTNAIKQQVMGPMGGPANIALHGQTASIVLPVGGIITEGTITLRQIAKTTTSLFTKGSAQFVYQVSTTADDGNAIAINRIEITLPLDLGVIAPQDLEKGIFTIYHAPTLTALEAGTDLKVVPVANIINTDYVGNGSIGSVTFWVDSLSVFAVGFSAPSSPSSDATGSDGGSGCFIATAAFGSPVEAHVLLLQKFRDLFLLPTNIGRSFVNNYYRLSPPIADFIAQHDTLRAVVRVLLVPVVAMSYMMVNFGLLASILVFGGLFALATLLLFRLSFTQKEQVACN